MALPPYLPTHQHKVTKWWSRLDNVWCTTHSLDTFVSCEAAPGRRGLSNHFPILSVLELSVDRITNAPAHNFHDVDWTDFFATLTLNLTRYPAPCELTSVPQFEQAAKDLTEAIATTIQDAVPKARPYPHLRRWWTRDLTKERKALSKLGREAHKFRALPTHEAHSALAEARKKY
ncbi:hypothetical protein OF83DRAFT_1037243, partial [Amylostereum chailletii]